jgi:MFS family permease
VFTLAVGLAPTAVTAGVARAGLGAISSAFNVSEYSILQEKTPPELRGRVFAVSNLAAQALRPPALIVAGVLAEAWNVRLSLAIMASAALIATAIAFASRSLRETR